MNILSIYPGLTLQKNDNAYALVELRKKGVRVAVIASSSLHLKGTGKLPPYEDMDGVPVYRFYRNPLEMFLYPKRKIGEILHVAEELKPDIIFCSQELNIRLALLLQKLLKKPIVTLVEEAGAISSGKQYRRLRDRLMLNFFGIPSGAKLWPWLCKRSAALITCHVADQPNLEDLSKYGKPVYYTPWPIHVPDGFVQPTSRNRDRGVYAGSLYPVKNTQEFELTLPRILEETPTKEFVVVGAGSHAEMIRKLEKQTNGKVLYIPELPRTEVLQLIASSHYAYTPVVKGGWGMIGDAWSVGTPVVMTHNDGYVTDKVNTLVAENEDALIENINRLYTEPELYTVLQDNGHRESIRRGAEAVSDELYTIFTKTLTTRETKES